MLSVSEIDEYILSDNYQKPSSVLAVNANSDLLDIDQEYADNEGRNCQDIVEERFTYNQDPKKSATDDRKTCFQAAKPHTSSSLCEQVEQAAICLDEVTTEYGTGGLNVDTRLRFKGKDLERTFIDASPYIQEPEGEGQSTGDKVE